MRVSYSNYYYKVSSCSMAQWSNTEFSAQDYNNSLCIKFVDNRLHKQKEVQLAEYFTESSTSV